MASILVVGSVALDTVKTTEGESVEALGGSATYFSLSASHFTKVTVVGVVGQDFPQQHRRMLEGRGIDLSGFKEMPGKTFRWVGQYGKAVDEAQTLETHLNVFSEFKPKLTAEQAKSDVLFLANIDPELQLDVLSQMKKPAVVALDTMNYWITSKPEALKKVLSRVNIFFVNEQEAKALTRQPNALRAANVLHEWGPDVVVVKKGEHGALLKAGRKTYAFPAFPLEAVKDPTGAGDTFAGGFMGYLAACNGFGDIAQLKRAMLFGTVMASFTCEEFSTARLETLEKGDLHSRFDDLADRLNVPVDPVLLAAN